MSDVKRDAKKQPAISFVYKAAKGFVNALFHTILPVRYTGRENLKLDAPYILIGNHLSMLDPFVMAVPVKRYQVRFMAKKELEKVPVIGWLLREKIRVIFVDRHNSDMEAMRTSLKVVREGGVLGIFPEGTRHHEGLMTELESGVALIALRSGVPLVPVYLPRKLGFLRPLHVTVGEPIPMDDLRAEGVNTATCQKLMERITQTYAQMAEKEKA